MHHLIIESNIEEALQAHGISKTDILVISHDIQNQTSQGNDALNQYFKQNLDETNKDIENKKQWVERKRSNEEFFENLNTSIIIEHVIMLKIFIEIIEKEISEKLAANENMLSAMNAEKHQHEIIIHEQEKLAEMNKLASEIKSMMSMLEKIDNQSPRLLDKIYQEAMKVKSEKWSNPLNEHAKNLVEELDRENNKRLIDEMNHVIDSQNNISEESKKQLKEGVLKVKSESDELIYNLVHNRATPEEKLKRVAPLLEAAKMNYDKARKENKDSNKAHKEAMDVMARVDMNQTGAAMKGAYLQRYLALDRFLRANIGPSVGIKEIYGKSPMALAGDDMKRGEFAMKKYHEELQNLVLNYNPQQGIQQLLELAHEREHLTNKIKTNVVQIGQIAEGIPEMKEQHKAGFQQLVEGMAGTPQQAEKMDRSVETAAARKGAYFQRYRALDRQLKASDPSSIGIQEIFGKSAMNLAHTDLTKNSPEMDKYHQALETLLENFDPEKDKAKLMELVNKRQELVGNSKKEEKAENQSTMKPR